MSDVKSDQFVNEECIPFNYSETSFSEKRDDTVTNLIMLESLGQVQLIPIPSSKQCKSTRNYFSFYRLHRKARKVLWKKIALIKKCIYALMLVAYLAYFAYCMRNEFGTEPSVRLLVCTLIGLAVLTRFIIWRNCPRATGLLHTWATEMEDGCGCVSRNRMTCVFRWFLYALTLGGAIVYVSFEVVPTHPRNLVTLAGVATLIILSVVVCTNPKKINWHTIFWGMALQFWLAVFVRRTAFGAATFEWMSDRLIEFLQYSDKGAQFTFGSKYLDHRFIFQTMPTIIFFTCAINCLYYLGIIQLCIAKFGKFLSFCLGTSPIESISTASNLFLSMAEAPILIEPFLADVTNSEMFAIMTAGYSSIAGSVFGAFTSFGAPPNHLLAASVMSIPAGLAFAKLMFPDDRVSSIKAEDAYKVDTGKYAGFLGAIAKGSSEGLNVVASIVVNLMVFIAIMEFVDMTVTWFSARAGVDLSFTTVISYVLYPLVYLMGFESSDCLAVARLLGRKLLTTTMMSYMELGHLITNRKDIQEYFAATNGTWVQRGNDVFLEATNRTLKGGFISPRSEVLATYMLCGMNNIGSIGIAVGCMSALAPSRTTDVIKYAPLALVAGNLACFSTTCIAGLLHDG